MNKKQKIEKLKALTESVKATQNRLAKAKKIEENLRATNIGVLLEAELAQAEVILAAKDFVSKLQKMAEDLANMQAESIPLGDSMKETLGPDAAQDFENAVTDAISQGLVAVRAAKDQINDSITRVEGGEANSGGDEFGSDMGGMGDDIGGGDEFGSDDLDLGGEEEPASDVFGGADASAGPESEPLGRGFKESYKAIGAKLLMTESLDSLVNWLFEDVSATMSPDQFPKFAGQIAMKGAQDSERLAGWIGKRKYGKGLGAQLSSPLDDMDSDILDEGRDYATIKKELDAEKAESKKAKGWDDFPTARHESNAKIKKLEAELKSVNEGKSYKRNDDEDADVDSKKKASTGKAEKAKAKRTVEEAVRLIIERNIAQVGKGFAAKAIAEAQSMFPMLEGTNESIVESFTEAFGMSPQAYSVKKARAVMEAQPLNPQDKKNAASVMGKIAGEMSTDKAMDKKGVETAMSKMDSTERATAQKVINNAKSQGKTVQKVGDLVSATKDELEENINAANWPLNSMGQYKGDAFSTDYNKLAPNKTKTDTASVKDSPKAADAPSAKTPWDGGNKAKAESPKTSDGATASTKPAKPSQDGVKGGNSEAPKKTEEASDESEQKD